MSLTYKCRGTGAYEVTFRGNTATVSGTSYANPTAMRETAAADRLRAALLLHNAARYEALADAVEADEAEREAAARAERIRKAAATRAKNKDRFGFRS